MRWGAIGGGHNLNLASKMIIPRATWRKDCREVYHTPQMHLIRYWQMHLSLRPWLVSPSHHGFQINVGKTWDCFSSCLCLLPLTFHSRALLKPLRCEMHEILLVSMQAQSGVVGEVILQAESLTIRRREHMDRFFSLSSSKQIVLR